MKRQARLTAADRRESRILCAISLDTVVRELRRLDRRVAAKSDTGRDRYDRQREER